MMIKKFLINTLYVIITFIFIFGVIVPFIITFAILLSQLYTTYILPYIMSLLM